MANTKISGLTALAAADVETDADVLAIVDDSATATKKITVDNLRTAMGPKLETEQATTSGTSIDFTSIPAWVKKITVMLSGVSTNGTSPMQLQVGDSGGVETSSYSGVVNTTSGTESSFSTGFLLQAGAATATMAWETVAVLTLMNSSSNKWAIQVSAANTVSPDVTTGAGTKALSGTLDRVRLTTVNGTDEFDAGAVNLLLE